MILRPPMHLSTVENGRYPWALATILLALFLLLPRAALASSNCSGNESVTANVSGVAFGAYDVFAAADTSGVGTVTVSASCRHNRRRRYYTLTYTIALSPGGSGSFRPRLMSSGSARLQYNLYTDAGLTAIWGDGSGGSRTVTATIMASCNRGGNRCRGQQTTAVYGSIPAGQNVAAGSYADTITVTVTY